MARHAGRQSNVDLYFIVRYVHVRAELAETPWLLRAFWHHSYQTRRLPGCYIDSGRREMDAAC